MKEGESLTKRKREKLGKEKKMMNMKETRDRSSQKKRKDEK